jgi:p-hydroxybenzoate 3-monooxygenase
VLEQGLEQFYKQGSSGRLERYTEDALKRVWRAGLENVVASRALATALAENYVGAF